MKQEREFKEGKEFSLQLRAEKLFDKESWDIIGQDFAAGVENIGQRELGNTFIRELWAAALKESVSWAPEEGILWAFPHLKPISQWRKPKITKELFFDASVTSKEGVIIAQLQPNRSEIDSPEKFPYLKILDGDNAEPLRGIWFALVPPSKEEPPSRIIMAVSLGDDYRPQTVIIIPTNKETMSMLEITYRQHFGVYTGITSVYNVNRNGERELLSTDYNSQQAIADILSQNNVPPLSAKHLLSHLIAPQVNLSPFLAL